MPANTSACQKRLPFTDSEQPPLQNNAELLLNRVARARVSNRKAMFLVKRYFKPSPILNDARRSDCKPDISGLKYVKPSPPVTKVKTGPVSVMGAVPPICR